MPMRRVVYARPARAISSGVIDASACLKRAACEDTPISRMLNIHRNVSSAIGVDARGWCSEALCGLWACL